MTSTLASPPQQTRRPRVTIAAIAFTVLSWASAFVVIRWVGDIFEPGPLALGRLVVGSAVLGAFLLARQRWVPPNRREWLLVVICGVVWFALYNIALNAAEQRVDAGTTAMLVNIGPLLIAVFAGLLLGEDFLVGSSSARPFPSPVCCSSVRRRPSRARQISRVCCSAWLLR